MRRDAKMKTSRVACTFPFTLNLFLFNRFSTKHKDSVKDGLDVDSMVVYLCGEITNGYLHLFQLAPPLVDTQELVSCIKNKTINVFAEKSDTV